MIHSQMLNGLFAAFPILLRKRLPSHARQLRELQINMPAKTVEARCEKKMTAEEKRLEEARSRKSHWRDLILFNEYFHNDNGAGLGAGHQTGWDRPGGKTDSAVR